MPKYFNTTTSPILYNNKGQTVDGYAWLETDTVTKQIKAALEREDLLELDSDGNFLYPNSEEPTDEEE